MTNPAPVAPSAPAPSGQCEALFKLFDGPTGLLRVGRLLKGHEAGRLVLLRHASGVGDEVLFSQAVDTARCIAHSTLNKVLGIVWVDGAPQVASEYNAGVSLFELRRHFASEGRPIEPRIAARIVCDALNAVSNASELLRGAGATAPERCLFPDTIWIAEFGETLLTEVGVGSLLNPESAPFIGGASLEALARDTHALSDIHAAGVELFQLLTNRPYDAKAPGSMEGVPAPLCGIVERALSDDANVRYADVGAMARELGDLPDDLIATESEVGEAIQDSMQATLKGRRQKLALFERLSAVVSEADEATQFFGSSGVSEVVNGETTTARPPAGPDSGDDDRTLIFRAPELEGNRDEKTERPPRLAAYNPEPTGQQPSRAPQTKRSGGLIALVGIVAVLSALGAAGYFGWVRGGAKSASDLPWPLGILDR